MMLLLLYFPKPRNQAKRLHYGWKTQSTKRPGHRDHYRAQRIRDEFGH